MCMSLVWKLQTARTVGVLTFEALITLLKSISAILHWNVNTKICESGWIETCWQSSFIRLQFQWQDVNHNSIHNISVRVYCLHLTLLQRLDNINWSACRTIKSQNCSWHSRWKQRNVLVAYFEVHGSWWTHITVPTLVLPLNWYLDYKVKPHILSMKYNTVATITIQLNSFHYIRTW